MNTLEMMIEEIYKNYGYMYNENVIHCVAEYIENFNANKSPDEPVLTPRKWYNETRSMTPEEFVSRSDLFGKVANYFIEQRKLCIDQTGCLPCYEDWAQEMESDEFKNTIGEWADTITITDFLNWLLDNVENINDVRSKIV